jgi:hypothetical protein
MAITGLDRRASKLEDSMDHLRRQKEAEERNAWRQENSERLQWEMFLRVHGPDSIEVTEEDIEKASDPENKEEIKAEVACKKMLQRVLAKYDGWIVDYGAMDETEKAFAVLLESFHIYENVYNLVRLDLDNWEYKLDLKPELSFVEEIKAIDEHIGSSDWREVCYLQENQDAVMERLFQYEEARRARYLRYKAEHPEEEADQSET